MTMPSAEQSLYSPDYTKRRLASSANKKLWFKFRAAGVSATDIAKLATPKSFDGVLKEKLSPSGFSGNSFTKHGNEREPVIAAWIKRKFKVAPSNFLYHSVTSRRHLATPDGLGVIDGKLVLAEIKTTNKPFHSIPTKYLRQIYWQQYVLGADETLFVWEEHENFKPLYKEPQYLVVERDENQISMLVDRANELLRRMDEAVNETPQPYISTRSRLLMLGDAETTRPAEPIMPDTGSDDWVDAPW